jgi:alanyl-tRNA synthetase
MTERLYYADPYLREFDAPVSRVERRDGRAAVVLDRTAFYPTSGGQPFDSGTLVGVEGTPVLRVLDVEDDGAHVAHVVDDPVELIPGQIVHGVIDWTRRFDHMQQHSGQHLLSAAIDRRFGVRTVSFHLGAAASTIDLSRELTKEELTDAELDANRVVWENRRVTIRYATAEEAATLQLRKESVREGTLRLIEIEAFDLSACGGTHVDRTGAIGIIAVGAVERFKGGQRVEFLCGGRALEKFRSMRDTLAGAVRALSVLTEELPGAIEKLQVESRERQKTLSSLQKKLAKYHAVELAAAAEQNLAGKLVARAVDADADGLKSLASMITAATGHIALLVSIGTPALVVVARSQDVAVPANRIVQTLIEKFGGRGGGRSDLAQAGGLSGTPDAILAAGRAAL